jgi:hypothetical protein
MCRLNQLLQIYDCRPPEFWDRFDYSGFFNNHHWISVEEAEELTET